MRSQTLAQALAAILKRAEPPICIGLYARWGAGKTFMISLLKKELDPDMYEDPHTKQMLQFFEKNYPKPTSADESEKETVASLIFGLLQTILLSFVPTMPYGLKTFVSIIYDAFNPDEAFHGVSVWCSRLRRSSWKKAKTNPKATYSKVSISTEDWQEPFDDVINNDDVSNNIAVILKKEFVFVHFNAWEYAACVNSL